MVGLVLGDFDGDGVIDLAGGLDDDGDSGQVWIWFGDSEEPGEFSGGGVPAFDLVPGNSGSDQPGLGSLTTYDVDGDGDLDLIASIQPSYAVCDRDLYVALNDGSGNFVHSWAGVTECQWGANSIWLQDFYGVPTLP